MVNLQDNEAAHKDTTRPSKETWCPLGPQLIEIVFGPDRTVILQYKTSVNKLTLEITRGWFAKSKAVRIENLASGLWD